MPSYQIVFVIKTGSDADRKKTVEWVKSLLKGMKVTKEEDLGSKALSYRIRHELSGHYYNLLAEGIVPTDFEKKVLENDVVLRHLVLRAN